MDTKYSKEELFFGVVVGEGSWWWKVLDSEGGMVKRCWTLGGLRMAGGLCIQSLCGDNKKCKISG